MDRLRPSAEPLSGSSAAEPYSLDTDRRTYRATSPEAVAELARRILDPERAIPIVGLTSRAGEAQPALDHADVLETLEGALELAAIPTGTPTRHLAELIPSHCEVYGGAARIWWPGFNPNSDPRDHPLVLDRHGVYGSQALEHLSRAWTNGPPEIEKELDDRDRELALLRDRSERSEATIGDLAERVRELEQQLDQAESRRKEAEDRAREVRRIAASAPHPSTDTTDSGDPDAAFLGRVFDGYLRSTTAADRTTHPLSPVVVGQEFCETLRKVDIDENRVAFVVALLLSNRLSQNFESHPLRAGRGGEDPQRQRPADGALAWRVSVKRNSPSAPRLHYWRHPDGLIELASVAVHDSFDIPTKGGTR